MSSEFAFNLNGAPRQPTAEDDRTGDNVSRKTDPVVRALTAIVEGESDLRMEAEA